MTRTRTRAKLFPLEESAYISQHVREHGLRQFPRKSILLAGMVRSEQSRQVSGKLVANSVTKPERRKTLDFAAIFQQPQVNTHRNAPKGENRARPQNFKLALEIRTAVRKLRGQRLVRGRRAANSSNDIGIFQREPVAAMRRSRLVRESSAKQRVKQEISRAIARKHPPGAVPSMRRGRESKDQQLRVRVAESRHRFAPVFTVPERQPLFTRHSFAVFHQPRTLPASDDFFVQHPKRAHQFSLEENYHETDVLPKSSMYMSELAQRKAIQLFGSFLVRHREKIQRRHIQ
jgi:hypothetical protein